MNMGLSTIKRVFRVFGQLFVLGFGVFVCFFRCFVGV